MAIKAPSTYSGDLYTNFVGTVDTCIAGLAPHVDEFDGLIATGLSGGALVASVATMLDKHWAIVRKDGASSHSINNVEGTVGDRWVFLDDFICSAESLCRCINAIKNAHEKAARISSDWNDPIPTAPIFVGTYCYAVWESDRWRTLKDWEKVSPSTALRVREAL